MEQKKGFLRGALCGALVMLLVVTAGCIGRKEIVNRSTEKKLEEIKQLIDRFYLREDEVKEDDLENYLLKGYVGGLKDPYSVYYNQEETKELFESTTGEYSGIGAAMSQDVETGIITINNVYKKSPAEEAGLKENDILYKVNGEEVSGQDLSKVVGEIKGEEGTEVALTVIRGKDKKEVETKAVRRKIEAQTVEYEIKDAGIGYLRITEFDSVTKEQFNKALADLQSKGVKGIIFDVRSNPGGNLVTVCEILDQILPEGTIVYTKDKNGKKEVASSDEEHKLELPIAVLVDGMSASAAEIFAGAIQDYDKGTLIGTTTYGKGVVQQLFELNDGTCLKLTISEYFTPKGRNIHGKGIAPDVEVKYQYNENNPEADNQLDKAMEIMNEKIK